MTRETQQALANLIVAQDRLERAAAQLEATDRTSAAEAIRRARASIHADVVLQIVRGE